MSVNSNTSAAANGIPGSESPVLRFLATRSGMAGPPRLERRGFIERHARSHGGPPGRYARSLPLEVPEYDKVYTRSGRHPAREEEFHARSHMQERHTRSHNDRPLGNNIIFKYSRVPRVLSNLTIGKREYPEDYVDYDIGYAKRNEDFAYDWAKRNGKALRKVIGVLFYRHLRYFNVYLGPDNNHGHHQ